jgi:tripartite-type tricarboxylate transporter receptor subunit TctC/quercetin dioxygenase-like cupin family protein
MPIGPNEKAVEDTLVNKTAIAATFCAIFSSAVLAGGTAWSQDYPNRPVKLQVAFAPGGPADVIARIIGQKLSERWKQSVVVENRGGAGGNIAAALTAKMEPDGYNILVTTSAFAVNQTLSKNPGYTSDDFKAVVIVASTPNLIIGAPGLKGNNLKEVVEAAKTEKMTYGTAGVGTTPHLSAERIFKLQAKVDIPHAPFTGAGPALQAVAGGHIPLASIAMSAGVENVKGGQVKGLAVTSKERVKSLPNVPTARELGLGEEDDTTWVVFFVPAKTPDAVINKINADVDGLHGRRRHAEGCRRLREVGNDAVGWDHPQHRTGSKVGLRQPQFVIKQQCLRGSSMQVRRVVTGHKQDGKATVMIDEISKDVVNPRQGCTFFNIWSTPLPVDNNDDSDGAKKIIGTAMKNKAVFRVIEYAPGVAPRNHRTDSIDFAVVMSGEIDMTLDDEVVHLKAGDVMVQRGTIHDWINKGDKPCIIAFVLIDAAPVEIDGKPLAHVG